MNANQREIVLGGLAGYGSLSEELSSSEAHVFGRMLPLLPRLAGSPAGIRGFLAALLRVRVAVRTDEPRTLTAPSAQVSRLGGRFCRLGADWVLGSQGECAAAALRVAVGPLDETEEHRLMEAGWVVAYGADLTASKKLKLAADCVVPFDLAVVWDIQRIPRPVLTWVLGRSTECVLGRTTRLMPRTASP